MKKYGIHVGIDISKLTLDVALLDVTSGQTTSHLVVANSQKGIKEMIKHIKLKGHELSQVLFCCENTGIYTYPLSMYLSDKKHDYWIVPAIEIKRSKGISRGKTDKTDAKEIALYSLRHLDKLVLSTMAEKEIQALRLLYTERQKISKALLVFGATSENKGFIDKKVYKEVGTINSKIIKDLKESLKKTDFKIKEIISSQAQLQKQLDLIKSVPGIGQQTATYMLIATKGFTAFSCWRKFACYCGTAPFEYSSGSSIRGKTKVNHIADKKMKSLLQMGAMSSIRHDAQMKEYYLKKKREGKHPMLVMNNVRNKMISRVFAVINRQTPFIDTFRFAA